MVIYKVFFTNLDITIYIPHISRIYGAHILSVFFKPSRERWSFHPTSFYPLISETILEKKQVEQLF